MRVRFEEGPHEYYVDGQKYDVSVTALWRKFFSSSEDEFYGRMIARRHVGNEWITTMHKITTMTLRFHKICDQ